MAEAIIKHIGIVSKLSDHKIEATIAVSGACGGCHAKSSCGMVDNTSRVITISHSDRNLNLGDQVSIVGAQSTGLSAVLFAYILPFIVLMLALVIGTTVNGVSELKAGLYALLTLPPYYISLYFFRDKFEKKYTFRIVS